MKYNPAAPEVKENPVPYYAYLPAHAPVSHLEDLGWLAISRYADVDFVLVHDSPRRTGSRAGSPRADSFGPAGAQRARANWPTP